MLRVLLLALGWTPLVAWAIPSIEHWQTEQGADVYFIPADELPMLDIRVFFRAGSAHDGDQPGLATFANSLLDEGAGQWDADTIAARFDATGAQYRSGSARDMAWVTLRTLLSAEEFDQALSTYLTVLGDPVFPADAVERVRRQMLVGLEEQAADPASIASKAFYRAVYGKHPYASPSMGDMAAVRGFSGDDASEFYERFYVAKNAIIALVGAIDLPRAQSLATRIAAVLEPGTQAVSPPSVAPLNEARTIRIAFPSEQAHILIGQPGMSRVDSDYFALYLGNHVFGGSGFTSRLVKEVRVERAFAYSVYSYFAPMEARGPFRIGLQTKIEQADEAVEVVLSELERFVEFGATNDEVRASKANITGGFPLRIASNQDLAEYAALIGFYGLPLDYLRRFPDRIEAVTEHQIRHAVRRRIDPKRLVTVIVGGSDTETTD